MRERGISTASLLSLQTHLPARLSRREGASALWWYQRPPPKVGAGKSRRFSSIRCHGRNAGGGFGFPSDLGIAFRWELR